MAIPIDSYLVRIYRRDPQEPRRVAGLVEIIERESSATFKSAEELMRILGIGGVSSGEKPGKRE
jgi:hypothetical protein